MHASPISAVFFVLASGGSAYLLSGRLGSPSHKAVRALAALVLWEAIQLIPVQLLAMLQMLGWVARVTVPALAEVQGVIFAGVAIWSLWRSDSTAGHPDTASHGEDPLPPYIWVAAAVLLTAYLAFAVNVFTSFPTGSDAVIYHLPLALRWLQDGSLAIPSSRIWQYSMPGNGEIGMMILLSSGKQSSVMMASWIPAAMLTFSIYLLAMWFSRGNRPASITTCLIVLSVPMVALQIFSAYVDLLGTAGIFAAFALILSADQKKLQGGTPVPAPSIFLISGMACGIGLGTKTIDYFYVALFSLIMVCLLWLNRDWSKKVLWKSALLVFLGMLLPSSFWFARALKQTGNPIYPIQVKVGSRVIFAGYEASHLTDYGDFEFSFVHKRRDWLVYPWTEWKRSPGYLKVPYGEGEGFGAVFATFVPLGIVFFFLRTFMLWQASRTNWILLLLFAALILSWWTLMERVLRYGQTVWVFACILSVPLIMVLQSSRRRSFAILMVGSVTATSVVCASLPLHSMAGRLRKHLWSRAQIYNYPRLIDELPSGSVVLNASGIEEKNFSLAGKQLTNRVIASFEAPAELTPESLHASQADYLAEIVPGGKYSEFSLTSSGATVMDDELVPTGEDKIRWRIWKVEGNGNLAH